MSLRIVALCRPLFPLYWTALLQWGKLWWPFSRKDRSSLKRVQIVVQLKSVTHISISMVVFMAKLSISATPWHPYHKGLVSHSASNSDDIQSSSLQTPAPSSFAPTSANKTSNRANQSSQPPSPSVVRVNPLPSQRLLLFSVATAVWLTTLECSLSDEQVLSLPVASWSTLKNLQSLLWLTHGYQTSSLKMRYFLLGMPSFAKT